MCEKTTLKVNNEQKWQNEAHSHRTLTQHIFGYGANLPFRPTISQYNPILRIFRINHVLTKCDNLMNDAALKL